jgi:hypothetical protein
MEEIDPEAEKREIKRWSRRRGRMTMTMTTTRTTMTRQVLHRLM